jgi:nickel transport protein
VRPAAGQNALWSGQRSAVSGDPRLTQRSVEYVLRFSAQ